MSQKFPGGFITKSPVAPTTTAASGIWTLDQQEQYQQAGTWPSPPPPPYIEDVFSTYLYAGSSGTVTNTNNIDISGKGGLVWVKNRSAGTTSHMLADTARGGQYTLNTDTTSDQGNQGAYGFTFSSTGFSLPNSFPELNTSGNIYTSWTFRKQAKFFDVVTYTGTGSVRTVAHNLGSVPGCIIIKSTTRAAGSNWAVYHRSLNITGGNYLLLNLTSAETYNPGIFNSTLATSTEFTVGTSSNVNASGETYVAYLFAHDAGGFGATETENVISCGTFTTDSSGNANVTLGYEPQYFLTKSTGAGSWLVADNMRGLPANGSWRLLFPNSSDAEGATGNVTLTSTGINLGKAGDYSGLSPNVAYIYIAIRRGPMKVPTDATTVFSPNTTSGAAGTSITTNFPVDLQITRNGARSATTSNIAVDRLRGVSTTTTDGGVFLGTTSTNGESTAVAFTRNWGSTGFQVTTQNASVAQIYWNFRRAPSFFDEVCYTGTGSSQTLYHNLGVPPELIIRKTRNVSDGWEVAANITSSNYRLLYLNNTSASSLVSLPSSGVIDSQPTATTITATAGTNTFVNYLFATCAGVSKVGSYTGNGTTQTINCGFTGGARFVLIKRTDSTGDWYVYDTARGMTVLTDPYLLLNSTAAESATLGSVITVTTGFAVNASILAAINTSSATYIFLAIA